MFRVNRQTDYAIRVILALAKQPQGTRLSSAQIGREMLIPAAFLSRIVAQLAQADLLKTFPGREGGLQLARPAKEITLRDVVEFMEGPFLLSECMAGEEACPFEGACPVRMRWNGLQEAILTELAKTNFSLLVEEANTHPVLIPMSTRK
ncbi:MAG: Rrf2 family transcriptional regulator [Chloroflexi bacterium]|nr:Rrf2 family transcriptional regulator [Chloroflexota bacterium]